MVLVITTINLGVPKTCGFFQVSQVWRLGDKSDENTRQLLIVIY